MPDLNNETLHGYRLEVLLEWHLAGAPPHDDNLRAVLLLPDVRAALAELAQGRCRHPEPMA